jgi:hypothetical protein
MQVFVLYYWVFALCPLSGVLKTYVPETESFVILRCKEGALYPVGSVSKG